ncbi:uncharacterized protein LOC109428521 [Aedes albopictus]|uniref:Cyclic nucleotide-binding domain-containing protein n=1 Tax=Aedes albopictus TaxID=7160 RepID=A0ABM1Y0I6_AEDAL|nr:uncharacterized protein LOC109428521 [Aedes albopictus]
MAIMNRFQYFNHWTDEQRRDCLRRAKVRTFDADDIIFEEGRRSPVNYVHFVLSGKCAVLQCLKVRKTTTKFGAIRYRLAEARPIEDEITQFHRRRSSRLVGLAHNTTESSSEQSTQRAAINYEYHFVDIGSYTCGSVFGVGEHMDDRSVVARDAVQCLVIPRYWLLQKRQNGNNVWNRIRIFLEQRQPSRQLMFEWYLKELRWRRLRQQLRDNVVAVRVRTNPTAVCDVPTLSRIEDSDVFA